MAIALDLVEFEQRQVHLVVDDLVIGAIFGRERVLLDGGQAIVKIGIELVLLVDAGRAEVVELVLQIHALVLVIAGLRWPTPAKEPAIHKRSHRSAWKDPASPPGAPVVLQLIRQMTDVNR